MRTFFARSPCLSDPTRSIIVITCLLSRNRVATISPYLQIINTIRTRVQIGFGASRIYRLSGRAETGYVGHYYRSPSSRSGLSNDDFRTNGYESAVFLPKRSDRVQDAVSYEINGRRKHLEYGVGGRGENAISTNFFGNNTRSQMSKRTSVDGARFSPDDDSISVRISDEKRIEKTPTPNEPFFVFSKSARNRTLDT